MVHSNGTACGHEKQLILGTLWPAAPIADHILTPSCLLTECPMSVCLPLSGIVMRLRHCMRMAHMVQCSLFFAAGT